MFVDLIVLIIYIFHKEVSKNISDVAYLSAIKAVYDAFDSLVNAFAKEKFDVALYVYRNTEPVRKL